MKYLGTKPYNVSFREEGVQDAGSSTSYTMKGLTSYTMKGLTPGSIYEFEIIVSSVCGLGVGKEFPDSVKTKIKAPISPTVLSVAIKRISSTAVVIHLWPAEQRNGPISSHQVIVLKVVDGLETLPIYHVSKMKDAYNAEKENLPFYVAAEVESVPEDEMTWEFTVGDGKIYGAYFNKELENGEDYIIYQRAITDDNDVILNGPVSMVAKVYVSKGECQVLSAAVIAMSSILFFSLVVNGILIWRLRRAELIKRTTIVDSSTSQVSPGPRQVSEPGVYMELQPRPSDGQSREPTEYQSLEDRRVTPDYYNMAFLEGRFEEGKVYENMK